MDNVIVNQLPFVLFMLLNLLAGRYMWPSLFRFKGCSSIGAAYKPKENLLPAVLSTLLSLLKIAGHLAAIIYLSSSWGRCSRQRSSCYFLLLNNF